MILKSTEFMLMNIMLCCIMLSLQRSRDDVRNIIKFLLLIFLILNLCAVFKVFSVV